jgi:CDP-4-dehydro-6-deoxyglucose reductase, E1
MDENHDREAVYHAVREYYNTHIKNRTSMAVPASGKVFDEKEILGIVDAALDCWWTEGRFSTELSAKLSTFLGLKHVLLVNSGSSANLIALASLTSHLVPADRRLRKGDEVITVAAGFPTTVSPVIQAGAVPVFVDVKMGTYNIDVTKLEDAVSEKTKAVFVAHTLGNPFPLDEVVAFCQKHNLWLIEDCCDALGSTYNGKFVGTFGDIATFSFYPAHQITVGEGGAVATNNPILKKILRSLRDWGRDCWCDTGKDNTCGARFSQQHGQLPFGYDHKFIYSHLGYNLKLTDMQAAIGVAQMDKLPGFIAARKKNFAALHVFFSQFTDFFILPEKEEKADPCWFGFVLAVKDSAPFDLRTLVKYLNQNFVGTRPVFAGNLTKQPCFNHEGVQFRIVGSLENADAVMDKAFWIGVYPGVTDEKLEKVYGVFRAFFEQHVMVHNE